MWRTILSYTILYYSILYSTVLYWPTALLYWIALYFIVFYCNIQPMLYHSILSYTVLYVLRIAMLLCQIKLRSTTAFYLTSSSWFVKRYFWSDRCSDPQPFYLVLVLPYPYPCSSFFFYPSFLTPLSLLLHVPVVRCPSSLCPCLSFFIHLSLYFHIYVTPFLTSRMAPFYLS